MIPKTIMSKEICDAPQIKVKALDWSFFNFLRRRESCVQMVKKGNLLDFIPKFYFN